MGRAHLVRRFPQPMETPAPAGCADSRMDHLADQKHKLTVRPAVCRHRQLVHGRRINRAGFIAVLLLCQFPTVKTGQQAGGIGTVVRTVRSACKLAGGSSAQDTFCSGVVSRTFWIYRFSVDKQCLPHCAELPQQPKNKPDTRHLQPDIRSWADIIRQHAGGSSVSAW